VNSEFVAGGPRAKMDSVQEKNIFISYSSKDRTFVQKLANDLVCAGVTVWWDNGEMKVGDSLHKKIQQGITRSSWLAVVLSPHSVASPWVEKELNAAHVRELERREVFILPILYKDCEIPLFIRDKLYADFRVSYEAGLSALLSRLSPPIDLQILKGLMSEEPPVILSHFSKIRQENKERYLHTLMNKLTGSSVGDKLAALTALYTVKDSRVYSLLLMMTKDLSHSVRRRAVYYLGELRIKNSISAISELLSDTNPDVRAEARNAHRKITGTRS
jgi:TIR domain/PBS lyase HEAT-like repeat